VVGGKDFTEQRLIAEITGQLLAAKGHTVSIRVGFATSGVRRELEAGLIDLYWEYTGTALLIFHGVVEKLSPEDAYGRVKDLDGRKGLVWLTPSRVDNTYALAMRRADADAKQIHSVSDLAARIRRGERLKLACNTEFFIRPDGLMPLERAYGFEFGRENVTRMPTGAVYEALARPAGVDVGLVFATDGRVAALDFVVLRDDKGFFPSYLLTPVIRKEVLDKSPGLADLLNTLAERLDNTTMANLNAVVDVQKKSVSDVAASFLRAQGLI
jgi:osmoprotectant transport system substrate-binding protein